MSEEHRKLAEYFERRAKHARDETTRERYAESARKYRDLAVEDRKHRDEQSPSAQR